MPIILLKRALIISQNIIMENNMTRVDNNESLIEEEIIGYSGYKNGKRGSDKEDENNRCGDSSPHTSIHHLAPIHSFLSHCCF